MALASEQITAEIKKVHDFLTVGAPAPLQKAAAFALQLPESYYADLQAFYLSARDKLASRIRRNPSSPVYPTWCLLHYV